MSAAYPNISPIDLNKTKVIQEKIDQKTKPIGALGYLEELAAQICLIQDTLQPELARPSFLLFAADHGLARQGISPYPMEVTSQMMQNFLGGGAAINVFCRQHDIELQVVDCGMLHAIDDPRIISRRLGAATEDMLQQAAMTEKQYQQGFQNGLELALELANKGCRILGLGEMGIGNSSAACLISARLLDRPIGDLVCPGAGCDPATLVHKQQVLEQVAALYPEVRNASAVMRYFGGFELVSALGAIFGAASQRIPVLIDGFIMSSVALVAVRIEPKIRDYMIFCHRSASPGHQYILDYLQAKPVLDLGMRLGEGSGAAIALPILQSAVNFFNEMASFAEAEVSQARQVVASLGTEKP